MAATKPLDLCVTAFTKPPSGYIKSYQKDKEFKYRGTLFRPSSAHSNEVKTTTNIKNSVYSSHTGEEIDVNLSKEKRKSHLNPNHHDAMHIKPRRIQSAKGRLERPQEKSVSNSSRSSAHPALFPRDNKSSDKKASVLNLNAAVDIPDKEEAELTLRTNIIHRTSNELNQKQKLRPSSAKSTFGCPVSAAEFVETEPRPANDVLKPAVYGLKLGRQVFGNENHIQEAWANTQRDYPFKLKEEEEKDAGLKKGTIELEKRNLPQTLKPLQRWLRQGTHSNVTGIDSNKCLVFLSRDYTAEDLPVVPPPQNSFEDLPYTCIVATPRKEVQKKYHHPYFEHEAESLEWKCSHTRAFDPSTHGNISFLLNPPYKRNPQEIRLEIAELENLMQGIGSLNSNCSFVKFQAEIRCARALARKLILPNTSNDPEEPTDSFGLLKFYKEHDKAMEIIHERRRICLQELKLIEEGNEK